MRFSQRPVSCERYERKGDKMSIKNRPYFVRADKWNDFLNHKTDDETLERCKRIDRMINMDIGHQEIKGENMTEQRLIDANMMAVEECRAYLSDLNSGKIKTETQGESYAIHWKIQQLIADTPTVDPETLPIVQKLREELARATAERDAAICLFNRIFDNFVKTADDEFYTAICGAEEKEILERKQKMAGKKEE